MEEFGYKLRQLRKAKRLSLKELGEKVGCSPSYLSMVETGKANPSVSRLKTVVDALGITIVELFQTQTVQNHVIRKNARSKGKFPDSQSEFEILVPNVPDRQIDARLAVIHPKGSSEGTYSHEGEEFGLVLSGKIELTINGITYRLSEGDSFYFKSSNPHSYRNQSSEDAVVIWVNHPASF